MPFHRGKSIPTSMLLFDAPMHAACPTRACGIDESALKLVHSLARVSSVILSLAALCSNGVLIHGGNVRVLLAAAYRARR